MTTYPKRPISHFVGDKAVRMFSNICPAEWVVAPLSPDYGLDLRVELAYEGALKGEEFGVQIKGRSQVMTGADGCVSLSIQSSTVNYWLGKLNPTMIVLADTENNRMWFNWLEYAYPKYPKLISSELSVDFHLSNQIKDEFASSVVTYVSSYFDRLRADLRDVAEDVQLSRLLLHVSALARTLTRIHLALTSGRNEKDLQDYMQLFLLGYGLHDDFLMNLWKEDSPLRLQVSSRVALIVESKLDEYIGLRNHFWLREKRVMSGEINFVPFSYKGLTKYLISTLESLWDMEEILNQLIVLN
jgi:hypothetical protein